jgi:nitrite reductase/ring-hydroxylating ferredoxin subunit
MTTENFQLIASTADIAVGKTHCVAVAGREVLLCNSKEGLFAIDNLCTHAEARLSEGKLKGCKLICPLHGAAFDIRDGAALSRPASVALKSYDLKVEDGQVFILIV